MNMTGIAERHAQNCATRRDKDAACTCRPTFQANVWSAREHKRIRKTFPTISAARSWRQDALVAIRRGTMRAPARVTLRQAWEAWEAGAQDGSIRTRSGDVYKPSVLRSYASAMRLHVLDELGSARLSDIGRVDLQDIADGMLADGLDPSTIRNALMPLRALFRRTVRRGEVAVNPTVGLELPAVRGKRDRIASPVEAAALIEALAKTDRALFACAFYAGLRLGELRALDWSHVDLVGGVLRIEASWDQKAGRIPPKSRAGTRTVPIASTLRGYLLAHRLLSGRRSGLVFGRDAERPFNPSSVSRRARLAWKTAKLEGLTLHECRHSFASLAIAAGVNAKALSTYLGHTSVSITYDRYGHLMPGNEEEAASLLDQFLGAATVAQTVARKP
jgi:integrase